MAVDSPHGIADETRHATTMHLLKCLIFGLNLCPRKIPTILPGCVAWHLTCGVNIADDLIIHGEETAKHGKRYQIVLF